MARYWDDVVAEEETGDVPKMKGLDWIIVVDKTGMAWTGAIGNLKRDVEEYTGEREST